MRESQAAEVESAVAREGIAPMNQSHLAALDRVSPSGRATGRRLARRGVASALPDVLVAGGLSAQPTAQAWAGGR